MYGYSDPIEDFFLFIACILLFVFIFLGLFTVLETTDNSQTERERNAKIECLTDGNDWFTSVNGRESGCIESVK